jgi:hypothetical protein
MPDTIIKLDLHLDPDSHLGAGGDPEAQRVEALSGVRRG